MYIYVFVRISLASFSLFFHHRYTKLTKRVRRVLHRLEVFFSVVWFLIFIFQYRFFLYVVSAAVFVPYYVNWLWTQCQISIGVQQVHLCYKILLTGKFHKHRVHNWKSESWDCPLPVSLGHAVQCFFEKRPNLNLANRKLRAFKQHEKNFSLWVKNLRNI